jgi:hypothetical protein
MAHKPYRELTLEQRRRMNQHSIASRRRRRAKEESYAEEQRSLSATYWRGNPKRVMLYHARRRALQKGIPCTITIDDFEIPTHCPVLGIKLARGSHKVSQHSSPSLDRVIPSKGYVPGNIAVISTRANRLKCDCTSGAELRLVADWLDNWLQSGQ